MKRDDRVRRLEQHQPQGRTEAAIRADAESLDRMLLRYRDAFADADAGLPTAALLQMSVAQHFAWAVRFNPPAADLAAIFRQHGQVPPACLTA